MITSTAVDKILPALLEVKKLLKPIKKNDTNPHFSHAFANIEAVIEGTAPVLHDHGLFFTHTLCVLPDGSSGLHTTLWHAASGQFMRGEMPLLLSKEDPQGQGSGITYARRYAEQAFLDLATVDDDGNQATQGRQASNQRQQQQRPAASPPPQRRPAPPCPSCGSVESTHKSTRGDGFYCNPKSGGCGRAFTENDGAPDPRDEVEEELDRIFSK